MKSEIQHTIGQNLQEFRKNLKLTREEVAERAGISVTFYANLEAGNRMLSVPTLRRLADVLCVTADSILYEKSENAHIKNIDSMLQTLPPQSVMLAEKLVRVISAESLSEKNPSQDEEAD